MASAKAVQGLKHVKPIFSANREAARRRVFALYRTWYRQLQQLGDDYHVEITVPEATKKLKEEFNKNRDVKDVRVIDLLCVKGQQELVEMKENWMQTSHLMAYFKDTYNPKPTNFVSKFIDGHEP